MTIDLGHAPSHTYISQMEIYTEIKKFTFYESSHLLYISCKIIEKKIHPGCHQFKSKFEELKLGETVSLKFDKRLLSSEDSIKLEELVLILLNRFLIIEISTWEPASSNFGKSSDHFIVNNAKTCGIFTEK